MAVLCWIYLAAVLAVWGLLYQEGDRWWLATVLLFAPRWLWGIPLVALVPLALALRRCSLAPLALAAACVVLAIMGFCVPWAKLAGGRDGQRLRVLTCNVGGQGFAPIALRSLVVQSAPDVVVLQECGSDEWLKQVVPANWHVARSDGLIVASRYPLTDRDTSTRVHPRSGLQFANGLLCEIKLPNGRVGVCNLHLRTPREGLEEVLDRKTGVAPARSWLLRADIDFRRAESEAAAAWLSKQTGPLVIAGDWNMPVESRIYRQFWAGFANAFSQAGFGFGATKITPLCRGSYGLRIDHVLFNSCCRAQNAWVAGDVGSDHLPLIADIVVLDQNE